MRARAPGARTASRACALWGSDHVDAKMTGLDDLDEGAQPLVAVAFEPQRHREARPRIGQHGDDLGDAITGLAQAHAQQPERLSRTGCVAAGR